MRRWSFCGALLVAWASLTLSAPPASAQPGSGPRETVNQSFTTTKPNSPTGASFSGVYHAARDPKGNPPYMRRMTFYPPAGSRWDTTVPARCTASDVELEVRGPSACPAASHLGGGTTSGLFFMPITHVFMSSYSNALDIFNGANQQIMVIQTPGGYTVVRGQMRPDNSVAFASPTCFPAPPSGHCADDHVLQLKSSTSMPVYTRRAHGRIRSYVTTPRTCPRRGSWRTRIKFWWADGSVDTVATDQPCRRRR